MKTKFTKVAVEERLPSAKGMYMVIFKGNIVGMFNFWNEEGFIDSWKEDVDFWLEESPDREDEMIEMLRKIEDKLNDFHNDLAKSVIDMEVYNQLSSDLLKIKSLLQSLKQPSFSNEAKSN